MKEKARVKEHTGMFNEQALSPESRIRKFYQLFMIIGKCNDSEQAIENLFADGKRKKLPEMSSLQKMAIDHLDWFGFACGIIKWNNN